MAKIRTSSAEIQTEIGVLSEKQREGRAANAVAELLMRKLLVPKIFLESRRSVFSGGHLTNLRRVDLLAIDRAGSGDIHAVEFKLGSAGAVPHQSILARAIEVLLDTVPAYFKYLAVDSRSVDFVSRQQLFAESGIGRIGVIEIVENGSRPPEARVAIQAERFRVPPEWIKKFDNFQKKTAADMEIRD